MALMQANNIPGQKRMMSPLGQGHRPSPESHQPHSQQIHNQHGHQVHHQQPHQSHMGHPSAGSCPPLLIRKDGDYHSSRLADGKDMQANQNMQPKKKHKKAGSSSKVKVEHFIPTMEMDDDDSSLKVQKNFICDHCYGAFRSSYHLKRHILTHTGEKPFACDACDMRFIQRYHLDRHKRVHSGEKPYQCDRCNQVTPIFLDTSVNTSSNIHAEEQIKCAYIYVPQPGTLLQTPGGGALALVALALAVALKNKEHTAWQL
ncbi:hypothetical protein KUCAC02_013173 [Chaenocephalus aceratus]|uniref:Uncharacterized protein n=1 Tax=Chaenocephalus aceratus TaxID=36190 RepID=A0ACB9XCS4_CHAAC|nr:hypothetical protein KUCAC02_013173 [Chaenocephalus aceratus]